MNNSNSAKEIKFSKVQALVSIALLLVLYEPVMRMVRQGIQFHELWPFMVSFIVIAYVFWTAVRISILMIEGVPAIILTNETITITQKGYTLEWKDIVEMNLVTGGGKGRSYDLVIEVKEPWKYIAQIKNPLVRNYCWFTKDFFKPFCINLSIIEGDSHEIYDVVETCYHQHK